MKQVEMKAKPDTRRRDDRPHQPPKRLLTKRPAKVDLRRNVPAGLWPIWDQQIPSCTAHATAGVALYAMIRAKHRPLFQPSRLFLYHCEKALMVDDHQTAPGDPGTVAYAMDILTTRGMCADVPAPGVPDHAVWPYDPSKLGKRPPEACFKFAAKHRIPFTKFYLLGDRDHLRACLAEGHPCTILVSQCSWSRVRHGYIPMPRPDERSLAECGTWHAMVLVGYDDAKRRFIVRNSMGPGWGDGGYGTISYDFAVDPEICDQNSFWTLRSAKG